jgi:hypothetical protein
MNFAPPEQPDHLLEGPPAEQPASPPAYVAHVQPVTSPSRRSGALIAGAVLAGAIGLAAVAVALGSTGTPARPAPPAPAANAPGVLLGADTGTWTPPGGVAAPNVPGGPAAGAGPGFGPGFGPGEGMDRGGRMGGRGILGSISITAIDGSKLGLKTADGWTRTIDATGATITKAGQTVDVSTLKVGDSIVFSQARQTDGSIKITAIQVVLPRAGGTVKSVSDTSVTLTQPDGTDKVIQLTDSTTYKLAGAAATKAALTTGAQVDAEGTTATDGTLTATVVNIRPAVAMGTVTAKDTSSSTITVKTRSGSSLTIKVTPATTYRVAGVANATFSDVAVGAILMAEGSQDPDGTFSATAIQAFSAGSAGGPRFGPGTPGEHWMPWGQRMPAPKPNPTPAGTTN